MTQSREFIYRTLRTSFNIILVGTLVLSAISMANLCYRTFFLPKREIQLVANYQPATYQPATQPARATFPSALEQQAENIKNN